MIKLFWNLKMENSKPLSWVLNMSTPRLGHILLRQGLIDPDKLDFCLSIQRNNGGERIGKVLKHYNFVDEDHIAHALAEQVGWNVFREDYEADEPTVSLLGLEFIKQRMVFPARTQEGVVFILSRTDDLSTTDAIQAKFKGKARFCIAPELPLRKALEKLFPQDAKTENFSADDLVLLLEEFLNTAIAKRATDIHIEPSLKAVEVRFRIDGMLQFMAALPLERLPRLVNIIFHKAEVAVSDFGHFHDAHFTHCYLSGPVDVRVSHVPCVHGSSLVLRLLDKSKTSTPLMALGYDQRQYALIQQNLAKPEGMTLIIGPTGCGKTTTLYAILNHLKSLSRKVLTIEDPVEIPLPLMTQVQINDKRSITFANALRAFLRHDPNIILIGEIRDQETAQQAIRASMTGHRVFATVHANRPLDAVLRLNDLGVPYTHMAGHLTAIIAQRLVRQLCPLCKAQCRVRISDLLSDERKYILDGMIEVCEAQGCSHCEGGYKGRTVVSEILTIDTEVEILLGEGNISGLRRHLNKSRRASMFDDARRLIKEGQTDLREAMRVLG